MCLTWISLDVIMGQLEHPCGLGLEFPGMQYSLNKLRYLTWILARPQTWKRYRPTVSWRGTTQQARQDDSDSSRRMADWFERVAAEEAEQKARAEAVDDKASSVGVAHNRWVKVPGETPQQAKERFENEAQLEADLAREGRRAFTGQVLPVRYDDDE